MESGDVRREKTVQGSASEARRIIYLESYIYLQRDRDCKVVGLPPHHGTSLISGSE